MLRSKKRRFTYKKGKGHEKKGNQGKKKNPKKNFGKKKTYSSKKFLGKKWRGEKSTGPWGRGSDLGEIVPRKGFGGNRKKESPRKKTMWLVKPRDPKCRSGCHFNGGGKDQGNVLPPGEKKTLKKSSGGRGEVKCFKKGNG